MADESRGASTHPYLKRFKKGKLDEGYPQAFAFANACGGVATFDSG